MIFKIQKKKINGKKLDANNMDGLIDPSNHLCYFFQLKMVTFFLILAILLQFSPVLFFFD